MCGINGIYNLSKLDIDQAGELIKAMNDKIIHRGPDDHGYWEDSSNTVFFGHRRLSIIDLSPTGHQPMTSYTGNTIVFNGEIFNFREINDEYLKDCRFFSKSDTETVLKMYEKFDENCLSYFNGMFAFALWDAGKKYLFLARDRAGKKPLYYSIQNNIFVFASEIKSLLELPWIKKELDEESLYHFLTFNKLPSPYTMFKNIYKFHPGYKMIVNERGIQKYESYCDIEYTDLRGYHEQELQDMVFNGLKKSVNYRMISDVPVGVFLSGGVDSSAMLAFIRESTNQSIKSFSIGFKDQPDYDELKYAEKVAKLFNSDHYTKIVQPNDFLDFLPQVTNIFDEPLSDPTGLPIYFISELASQNEIKVVITGDGSDEIFAGYRNFKKYIQYYPLYNYYLKFPRIFKKVNSNIAAHINKYSPFSEILSRAVNNEELFWLGANGFKESFKRKILHPEFLSKVLNLNSYSVIENYKRQFDKLRSKYGYLSDYDWFCFLGYSFIDADSYLFRADRLAMAHSVETRTPFLDFNFVNFALSVPFKYKYYQGEPKYILKKSLESILPKEILYRKKMGFCVPLKEWAGEFIIDYVENETKKVADQVNLFNMNEITHMINVQKMGNNDVVNSLWTVFFLTSWLKRWIL